MIKIKRVYDGTEKGDGYRVLVDRLWPRGVSKEKAKIDLWLKDIGPSDGLRKWFGHDPEKWKEFKKRYEMELKENEEAVDRLKHVIREEKTVTFVFAAKDEDHNNAVVLRDYFGKGD
ncbi:MAG: DUF488 domain-containing protein [Chloroflexi bacterium]|nr:DUF488 domain-containing protein [Chloroflexota bacterium]